MHRRHVVGPLDQLFVGCGNPIEEERYSGVCDYLSLVNRLANLRQTLVTSARSAAPRTPGPTTPTRSPSGSAAPGEGAGSVAADEAAV
jgi:hypothetical protein